MTRLKFKKIDYFKNSSSDIDFHWYEGCSPKHSHDYFEIFLITQGSLTHSYLSSTTTLNKNDMVLVIPKKEHKIDVPAGITTKHLNLSFTRVFLKNICDLLDASLFKKIEEYKGEIIVSLSDEEFDFFISFINRAHFCDKDDTELQNSIYRTALTLSLTMINLKYFSESLAITNDNMPKWMKTFITRLQNPEVYCLPMPKIYRISGYSASVLISYFKKYTGQTIISYITNLKMNHAERLLRTTNFSILDISLAVDYNSLSHFVSLFKKHTGYRPTEYRRLHYK